MTTTIPPGDVSAWYETSSPTIPLAAALTGAITSMRENRSV